MARIRTIKPEFWTHPIMSRQSDATKLLAIALLNLADDKGYFHAEPNVVRGICRPFDETSKTTRIALDALVKINYIEICQNDDYGTIGWIVNFTTHQKIDHPGGSRLECYFTGNHSPNVQRIILEQSPLERKGKEKEGKGGGKTVPLPPSISGAVCMMNPEEFRDQMTGHIFIEGACMSLHCDEAQFRQHVEDWVTAKIAADDYHTPIGKLKTYCISDFKKLPIGKVKKTSTIMNDAAKFAEILEQSKK